MFFWHTTYEVAPNGTAYCEFFDILARTHTIGKRLSWTIKTFQIPSQLDVYMYHYDHDDMNSWCVQNRDQRSLLVVGESTTRRCVASSPCTRALALALVATDSVAESEFERNSWPRLELSARVTTGSYASHSTTCPCTAGSSKQMNKNMVLRARPVSRQPAQATKCEAANHMRVRCAKGVCCPAPLLAAPSLTSFLPFT